ncbi:transporter, NhaC family [Mesobacillus persicus]|uniref:Transporter, NhaC family n=1 Tax=Mesobacillus persicus TaxID=930146 RepID=A0A1H8FR16_9BACI|nr:Na+/H+ antiporter NhaC family protein [Mesobacillus persicus]SEN33558.1 transporter, NhaC family [Mesobacillus persicus]
MQHRDTMLEIRPLEALLMVVILLTGISFSMIKLQLVPHIPIVLAIFLLLIYGMIKRVKMKELEAALMDGAKNGLGAVLIFFFIGMLISSLMAGGTIPTFIYLAFELVTGKWFYAIVFVVTAAIGVGIGSSLTTAATIGAAFMGVSGALELSAAITAGAIVSGAFFGDKMSPLSDTTTLASSTVKVDLFEHIKNMAWTTVPAFVLSLVIFGMLSPTKTGADFATATLIKQELVAMNLVHWYSLIPFIVLAILAVKKVPAVITLGSATLSAMGISLILTSKQEWGGLPAILYSGYKANTDVEVVATLLSRGGIESMLFSVSLVLLALSMGGLLFKLGIIPGLLSLFLKGVEKVSSLILSASLSAIGINFLIGEQYLSIIMTGHTFDPYFRKANLHPKNLSRLLEDAGTVINPLVPWSVCGVFLAGVLGVPTTEYALFAIFCLASPVLTILAGLTKISISNSEGKAAA